MSITNDRDERRRRHRKIEWQTNEIETRASRCSNAIGNEEDTSVNIYEMTCETKVNHTFCSFASPIILRHNGHCRFWPVDRLVSFFIAFSFMASTSRGVKDEWARRVGGKKRGSTFTCHCMTFRTRRKAWSSPSLGSEWWYRWTLVSLINRTSRIISLFLERDGEFDRQQVGQLISSMGSPISVSSSSLDSRHNLGMDNLIRVNVHATLIFH